MTGRTLPGDSTPGSWPRRRRWSSILPVALVLVLAAALAVAPTVPGSDEAQAQERERVGTLEVTRYAGVDRFDTARKIATDDAFDAPRFGNDTALVARADTFPDSLAGSYLAGATEAPILLTDSHIMTDSFRKALDRSPATNLILLGGEAAISADIERTLAEDHNVLRVSGADRFATAAEIARHTADGSDPRAAIVSSGLDFPDALTAGPLAAAEHLPLLLTARATLPGPTEQALHELDVEEVILTGGEAAVSADVERRIEDLGISVTRVFGADRFGTARAIGDLVTDRFGWRTDHVNLTNGLSFPDAVTMGAHAGLEAGGPAPIALAASALPAPTADWFRDLAACDFARLDIAGGVVAVPEEVEDAAVDALRPDGCQDDSAPEVAFDAPADGSTVLRDQDGIELRGTASDDETGVRKVEIFVGDRMVGVTTGDRTTDPLDWTVEVTPPEERTYTFTAVATDGTGETGSATLEVTVEAWDPGETIIDEDVQVLGDAVIDYQSSTGRIVLDDQPSGDPVLPGDTLVGDISAAAPRGFLRNVVTVRRDEDGRLVIEAVQGDLTDAFRQVAMRTERPMDLSGDLDDDGSDGVTLTRGEGLPPSDTTKLGVTEGDRSDFPSSSTSMTSTSSSGSMQAQASDTTAVQETWNLGVDRAFFGNRLEVQAQNEFGIALRFRLKIKTDFDWFNTEVYVDHFKLVGEVTEQLDLSATVSDKIEERKTETIKTVDLPTIKFWAGAVPVVITSDIAFKIEAGFKAQAEVTSSLSAEFELAAGTQYRHEQGWEPVNRSERSWSTDPLEFSAEATADAFLSAGLGVKLYDAVGPRFSVGPFVELEVTSDPTWTLSGGLRGQLTLEGQVPVVGTQIAAKDFPLFEAATEVLATHEDYPEPASGEPEPPAVKIVSPSASSVGCCEVLLRGDTDSPRMEDDESMRIDYRSDVDGDLPDGFGRDPVRVSLSPGTHTITAEVEEYVEEEDKWVTGTDQITLEVDSSRRPSEQFHVSSTADRSDFGASVLAQVLKDDDEVFLDGAEFLSAPPVEGFAGVVENAPGGFDEQGVILTTGRADDADTANEPDEPGTDLGGGNVRGNSDRDVTIWAIHLGIPEHGNCLVLEHRFLSEEIPRFVGSEYNDAFVAEVFDRSALDGSTPSDAWSVTDSELSAPASFALGPGDFRTQVNASESGWVLSSNAFQTTYSSGHPRMRAASPVTPGSDQTLVLSLLDQGDGDFDSAVVLDKLRVVQVQDPSTECVSGVAAGGLSLTMAR